LGFCTTLCYLNGKIYDGNKNIKGLIMRKRKSLVENNTLKVKFFF